MNFTFQQKSKLIQSKKIIIIAKYGIAIVALLSLLLSVSLLHSESPNNLPLPMDWISDFASILDADTHQRISSLITELERKTSTEIAVVTIRNLEGSSIEDFAVKLFKNWGIGKKNKDNGVLFLTAVDDRKTRIEVGYGLEGLLPDGVCGEILDRYIIPYFKQGDYNKGIMMGTAAIAEKIAKDANVELSGSIAPIPAPAKKKQSILGSIAGLFFLCLLAFLFIRHPILFLFLLSMGMGGRRGGGGGFGGGFGGFGGGMSGGGGASRGW